MVKIERYTHEAGSCSHNYILFVLTKPTKEINIIVFILGELNMSMSTHRMRNT